MTVFVCWRAALPQMQARSPHQSSSYGRKINSLEYRYKYIIAFLCIDALSVTYCTVKY